MNIYLSFVPMDNPTNIIITQLNIRSIRNNFDGFVEKIKGNVNFPNDFRKKNSWQPSTGAVSH